MTTLSNEMLRCDLDHLGRIVWLENRQTGHGNVVKSSGGVNFFPIS